MRGGRGKDGAGGRLDSGEEEGGGRRRARERERSHQVVGFDYSYY
jgi:hypothetical protein